VSAKSVPAYRRAMRERGYLDGRAGKPAAFVDAIYQASWRRGREARAEAGKVSP
jgi:hypothetical protein